MIVAILVRKQGFGVRIGGEIDGRKRYIAQKTSSSTLVQSKQAQFTNNAKRTNFATSSDFTGNLFVRYTD